MNRSERRQAQGAAPSRSELEAQARRRRTIIYGSLIAVALIAIVAVAIAVRNTSIQSASNAPDYAKIAVGQQAPEFAVSTTAGPFDLKDAGGKPTLLELYATWCPHCQREVAVLDGLYAKYKGRANLVGVSASPLGIDQTTPESQADVIAFMQRFRVTYPIAFDPNLDVEKKYLQGGFPTIVLIGKDGKILAIGSGEISGKGMEAALEAAIAGKPVDPTFGEKKS